MTNKPSILSFFSGAGFLDLGFQEAGYDVIYVNEVHRPFIEAYRYSRANMGISESSGSYDGDVADLVVEENKPRSDAEMAFTELLHQARSSGRLTGFIGGPPCPDFSIGGKNRGRFGENGKLSETYVQLICQREPDFFLFENVRGLFRTKTHRAFFDELRRRLHDSGYVTTHRLVNTIEFGVPQDRDRIILLGFSKEVIDRLGLADAVAEGELSQGVFPWSERARYNYHDVMGLQWPTRDPFCPDSNLECPPGIPEELTVEHWFRGNRVDDHPNSTQFFRPRQALHRFETIDEGDDSRKSFKRLHRWRYSPTVCYGNNEVHLHPYKPRRLSVAEALSLQSLPRDFMLPTTMSLSNAFKAIGNGVPFVAAREIAATLLGFLEGCR